MSGRISLSVLCSLCFMTHAHALTYDQALDQAIGYDKKYASAIYEARSAEYLTTIGMAGLLPKVMLTGFKANNNLTQNQPDIFGNPSTAQQNYTSQAYAAQLTQPLLNLSAIASYLQSTKQGKAAQQKLRIELNDLKYKAIEAYCSLALAKENYTETAKELNALIEQEQIVSARQLSGASSKTDVEEVTYALLQTQANLDDAKNTFMQAKITLEKLIGSQLSAKELFVVPQTNLPTDINLDALISSAKEKNPKILYQQGSLESAIYENKKNKAAYMPTIDMVAYQGYQNSNTLSTIGQKSSQGYLGMQLNIPLSTNGEAYGKERQSAFYVESQRMLLESEINDAEEAVKKQYFQIKSSNEKLSTLRLQTQVADRLYSSFLRQKDWGTKSTYELLTVLRKKFQSARDLVKTKYERIQAIKKLEVTAEVF